MLRETAQGPNQMMMTYTRSVEESVVPYPYVRA